VKCGSSLVGKGEELKKTVKIAGRKTDGIFLNLRNI